jgi:hypothetical protein
MFHAVMQAKVTDAAAAIMVVPCENKGMGMMIREWLFVDDVAGAPEEEHGWDPLQTPILHWGGLDSVYQRGAPVKSSLAWTSKRLGLCTSTNEQTKKEFSGQQQQRAGNEAAITDRFHNEILAGDCDCTSLCTWQTNL